MFGESEKGIVAASALSELFGVSAMTVPRDLNTLEEAGLVRRVHGSAVSYEGVIKEVILVADGSKYGRVGIVQIAPPRSICKIVTDDGLPAPALEAIEAEGVRVLTPGRPVTADTGRGKDPDAGVRA